MKKKDKKSKKLQKKIKKYVKNSMGILFMSGVAAALLGFVYNIVITTPKTWITIDSLVKISDWIRVPSTINLNSNKIFTEVYENSFVVNLYIKNNSDNELIFSNLKFNMQQYQCDFPILDIKGYVENNIFKVDVYNLTDNEINDLDFSLNDKDYVLNKLFKYEMNARIQNLKAGETITISFFSLEDIIGKKVGTWNMCPYIIVKDANGNILITNLGVFSINEDELNDFIEDRHPIISDKYRYDLTPDIIIGRDEIKMPEIKEFIPAHETLNLQLLVVSEVTCAFDLQVSYWLDDKECSEDKMSFIIYNPDNQSAIYEYYNEYIEIP